MMRKHLKNGWYFPAMVIVLVSLFSSCSKNSDPATSGTFTDQRDQHRYRWVLIGSQTWMAENLAYLPDVAPSSKGSDTARFYYVFRFEGSQVDQAREWEYYSDYGVFYNWPAAMDGADSSNTVPSGVKGICPDGWHLPSDGEWDQLVDYLDGEYLAGKAMKSKKGWNSFDGEPGAGDNSSGFNALPAGSRSGDGVFNNLGFNAVFWSATGYDNYTAWYRHLGYFHNGVYRYYSNKSFGFSVRCIKNTP